MEEQQWQFQVCAKDEKEMALFYKINTKSKIVK